MIRKITSLILTISLLCTFSAGCQRDDKVTDNKEETPEKLVYRPDPVTIVVYTTSISEEFLDKVNDLEDRIRDTLNIHFDIRVVPNLGNDPNGRRKAVKKFLESGTEFDLLVAEVPAIDLYLDRTYNNADLIAMGHFMDITDLLPLYAPKYYSQFSPGDLQAISYNGRIYNIPELTFELQRPCVLAWQSMIEKYSIEDIKTFEDYVNYMELIKEKEKDYLPCLIIKYLDTQMFIELSGYVMLCGNIVYRRDDPEMKLIPWEQTGAFKEAISTIGRWKAKGYDFWSSSIPDKSFTSLFMPQIPLKAEKNNKFFVLPNEKWTLHQLYLDNMLSRIIPDRRIFISKNSKKAERILRFIEWLNESQENYDLGSVIGPNNFYYERYDENNYHYFFDREGYINAVTRNSTYPPHSGYNPPVRLIEKMAERCADFDAFFMEYDLNNILISDEAIAEFIQEQKNKGIDALVKELQEDLDAWRLKQSG